MNWPLAADITTALVAVVAAPVAYITYRRSVRTKRAEWLASLHETFFETERYAHVRRVLDYQEEPLYTELAQAVAAGTYLPLADEFYRYLNFFELMASLRELREISDEEILGLFEYDLRLLTKHRFILDALPVQGFERLPKLLQQTRLIASR
jgi:hypothetical protein